MTMIATDGTTGRHIGELKLRRYRVGELGDADREGVARHADGCGQCRSRLRHLDEEQRQFEREIPFERFAGGVERAERVPRERPRRLWTFGSVALAAAAALVVVARTGTWRAESTAEVAPPLAQAPGANRIKGPGIEATIRIGGGGAGGRGQRAVSPGGLESLATGERVRIGVRTDDERYVVALSIDERGEVTTLYAERGAGLRVAPTASTTFLPDSLEFTGQGRERVVVLMSERPVEVAVARAAAQAAFRRAGGDLARLASLRDGLGVPAAGLAEFTWLLRKP